MNNRVIKFRAWNESAKRFSKPFTLFHKLLNYTDDDGLGVHKSLSDEIICQYTGLKDKNGIDIYEGDLLKCGDDKFIMKVIWLDNLQGWRADILPSRTLSEAISSRERAVLAPVEIIGSIHSTPEILEYSK